MRSAYFYTARATRSNRLDFSFGRGQTHFSVDLAEFRLMRQRDPVDERIWLAEISLIRPNGSFGASATKKTRAADKRRDSSDLGNIVLGILSL